MFMVLDKNGQICGMMVVHVDDGVWAGQGREFEQAQKKLRSLINIKVEKNGSFEILGRHVEQTQEGIRVQQWDYVSKITPITVPAVRRKCKDAPLTPQERTQYLSVTQQLSWPARTTMPGLCYRISELQQKANKATVNDLVQVNSVLKVAQQMGRDGTCVWFRKPSVDMGEWMIVAAHDASFANQPRHRSQQGHLVSLGPRRSLDDTKSSPSWLLTGEAR